MERMIELRARVAGCNLCGLIKESGRPTPFHGTGSSGLMFVLRNPGIQERDEGRPATGKVHGILHELLQMLGENWDSVCVTNLVNCYTCLPRPNRPPLQEEIVACTNAHFVPLWSHLKPKLTVFFGKESFVYGRAVFCGVTEKTVRGNSGVVFGVNREPAKNFIFGMEHPAVPVCYDPRMMPKWESDSIALRGVWNAIKAGRDPRIPLAPVFSVQNSR